MLIEEVAEVIREVATVEVVSRFKALAANEIIEKSPGDLVTIADRECERVLAERLAQIRDIPVVGEEGTSADSSLLALVDDAPAVWVVDPVDGTKNFAKGDPNYAVMVALLEDGRSAATWVWRPEPDDMYTAARGQGIRRNGKPLMRTSNSTPTGILKRGYMPKSAQQQLSAPPSQLAEEVRAIHCAGVEYTLLAEGSLDYLAYYRTWPWDHAPGSLLATEAGLRVARLDGSPYLPGDGRDGLLAATPELWQPIADHINEALNA